MNPRTEAGRALPEPIPSKATMRAALQRLYDESNVRNGLLIHNPDEATDAIRAALLAVPALDTEKGLRADCPKCGKADIYDSWEPTYRPDGRLARRCRNCRYSWIEAPLDASPVAPKEPEPGLTEALDATLKALNDELRHDSADCAGGGYCGSHRALLDGIAALRADQPPSKGGETRRYTSYDDSFEPPEPMR